MNRISMRRIGLAVLPVVVIAIVLQAGNGTCGTVFDRVTKTGVARIGVPYNRVPQGFIDPNGKWVGFEVDLARELARHMNLKPDVVKINDRTWGPALLAGRIDAAMCAIRHTRSLDAKYDFSVPYFYDSVRILVMKGVIKTPEELKGHKIAAVQGSLFETEAMKLLRSVNDEMAEKNVVSYPDRPSCFMALGREKVAAWIDSGIVLLEYASRSSGRFQLIKGNEAPVPLAVAVPQDDSAWRDLINFAIQDMAADGSLTKIYDKWFGPDTPHAFKTGRTLDIWPE